MIWFDGRVHDAAEVPFDLRDRGLLLGDGLFETLLVVGGTAFLLEQHLARIADGARALNLPLDDARVRRAIDELARRCADRSADPAVVRVTVTRGSGPRGLAVPCAQRPLIFAAAAAWSPSLAFRPQRLATSAIRRNETSPLSRLKTLGYLDNVLALEAAVAAGADDALLLGTRGTVCCTSAANVFVLEGDRLSTPPVRDGVLPGTLRALLLALAPECGLQPVERSVAWAELGAADAVLTTSSVRLVAPAVSLDGEPVRGAGSAKVRDLSERVRREIARACGTALPAREAQADPGSGRSGIR